MVTYIIVRAWDNFRFRSIFTFCTPVTSYRYFFLCSTSRVGYGAGSEMETRNILTLIRYSPSPWEVHPQKSSAVWREKFPLSVCCPKWIAVSLILDISVAECGSGMFIPDPRSWFLPIPDPGSKNSQKFHIIENYFMFEMLKKKIWANFKRII